MIVTETNLPFLENFSYFGRSDEAHIIYNFSLAPLIINTLIKSNSSAFRRWSMRMPPAKNNNCYLNFLATHDGIGLRPLEGIISKNNIKKLIAPLKIFGAKLTYRKDKDNQLSVYEANISLIDAMAGTINGKDNFTYDRFFCAHAIMLCFEGIPSFYIHSLFGTRNDYELLKLTKIFRSINRHIYDYDYLKTKIYDSKSHISKVYNQIIKLIEVRKKQKAFHPNATQYTLNISNNFFGLWRQSIDRKQSIFAISNVTNKKQVLSLNNINILSIEKWYDLLSLKEVKKEYKNLTFEPYQTVWIANKRN
jgi:sucrose phosphorylase